MVTQDNGAVVIAYLEWLIDLYNEKAGGNLGSKAQLLPAAIAIIKRHSLRWPEEDDFISLVAIDFADRIQSQPDPSSFLKLLDQVSDAVRHRVARAAAKRSNVQAPSSVASPQQDPRAIAAANEVVATLSAEEQKVLELLLQGVSHEHAARLLNVSQRTIYRRLQELKARLHSLSDPGGPSWEHSRDETKCGRF